MERSSRSLATGFSVLALVLGCASVQNTPQQDYVWEMGRICDGRDRNWYIDRVEPDGRYTVRGATNSIPGPKLPYFDCMAEQFKATPYDAWLKRRSRDRGAAAVVAESTDEGASPRPIGPRSEDYFDVVREKIRTIWVYPPEASGAGVEGTGGVLVEIARDGSLIEVRVTTPSGSTVLDRAAIAAVRSSAPFPPVPDMIAGRTVQINASFRYRIEAGPGRKEP